MATGISKHEQHSQDAKLAKRHEDTELPLPADDTPVELSYPGKLAESRILSPLRHDFYRLEDRRFTETESIPLDSFILADNFLALHGLLASRRKVSLIYLDPPYGTGMDFQSRQLEHAYKDDMLSGRYLEFMRRRLILMRELLADDGSIYLHIGHQMVGHLKVLMDEIFGAKNFRNLITRRKCSSKNFTRNQYANLNDYILFYSKGPSYIWNKPGVKPDQEWIEREYPKSDAKGRYKLVPIHAPGTRRGETGKKWRHLSPPPGKHWQFVPQKLDAFDKAGEIHWSKNGNPRRKVYLAGDKSLSLSDYWEKFRDAHHQSIAITGYPTEKNLEMLELIVKASSNEGDVVLDPFCGSGTTLEAAGRHGRKWIGVDQSLVAAKTTFHRLNRGTRPMGDYVKRADHKQESFKMETRAQANFIVVDNVLAEYGQELLEVFN